MNRSIGSSGIPGPQMLQAAVALGRREQFEVGLSERIGSEVSDTPYLLLSPKQYMGMVAARAAVFMERLQEPDRPISASHVLHTTHGWDGYEIVAAQMSLQSGSDVSPFQAASILQGIAEVCAEDPILGDTATALRFKKELTLAQTMAGSRGLSLVDVFTSEQRYHSLISMGFSERDLAVYHSAIMAKLSPTGLSALSGKSLMNLLPSSVGESISPEELKDLVDDLQSDPANMQTLNIGLESSREANRQRFAAGVQRFWGLAGIVKIYGAGYSDLKPKRPLVPMARAVANNKIDISVN